MKNCSKKRGDSPFITFDNVTLRVRDRHILPSTHWEIKAGQSWAVIGPNGSGKSTLMRALAGETPVVGGHIHRHHALAAPEFIGYVSFELHRQLIARDQAADAARYFSGNLGNHLTSDRVLDDGLKDIDSRGNTVAREILAMLGIERLLNRPVRFLSTGEIRRILIARAVLRSRGLLLLDEPFEGLDRKGCRRLEACIELLLQSGMRVMLATHRMERLLPAFSHVIGLKEGRVACSGPRDRILNRTSLERLYGRKMRAAGQGADSADKPKPGLRRGRPEIIQIINAGVRYRNRRVFENLSWTVRKGENWSITGPNGSGKTTLLQMVTADHPQAYANEVYLFGRRRGSGESIWDIKQRLGVVSSEFQINYRKPIRAFDVVLSGFFDSVGLYRKGNRQQSDAAREWIDRLMLGHLKEKRYDLLSFGERRMILLARAVVKTPEVLVLDEPCQGLDPANRQLILDMIDRIGSQPSTQILYVSHYPEDMPACITHNLDLEKRALKKRSGAKP